MATLPTEWPHHKGRKLTEEAGKDTKVTEVREEGGNWESSRYRNYLQQLRDIILTEVHNTYLYYK